MDIKDIRKQQEEQLNKYFDDAGLTDAEKEMWAKWIGGAPVASVQAVLDMFEILPGEVKWFTDMQIRKEGALSSQNKEEWSQIIEEEKEHLSKLSG